jgi:hypothetical protein
LHGLRRCDHAFIQAGVVAHIAAPKLVWSSFGTWLRTIRPDIPPSGFVVANALRQTLPEFLMGPAKSDSLTTHRRASGHAKHANFPLSQKQGILRLISPRYTQNRMLHHITTRTASAFDNAPATVLLAVLPSLRESQVHRDSMHKPRAEKRIGLQYTPFRLIAP